MSNDRWRDTYDAWKTSEPYLPMGEWCEQCFSDSAFYDWHENRKRWLCSECWDEHDRIAGTNFDCVPERDDNE